MFGYIYKTTNLVNNKIYIGQKRSSVFVESYLGSGKTLKKAIKKYGEDNFSVQLIEWCESKSCLDTQESYWIEQYSSTDKNIGYNIASGGQGGDLGHEVRQKISDSLIGKNTWTKGRTTINNGVEEKHVVQDELPDYLQQGWNTGSLKTQGRVEGINKRKVAMSNKSYEDVQLIYEKINIARSITISTRTEEQQLKINHNISEGRKASNNLNTWNKGKKIEDWMTSDHLQKFKQSLHKEKSNEHKKKLSQTRVERGISKGKNNPRAKRVLCIETNKIYDYSGDAAVDFDTSAREIRKCCTGNRENIKGFTFKYVE